jgi:Holliday junction resolvase RusA-like endonuclease
LNGIAYKDDSQIVKFGEMTKQYAEEDRVEITIKEITNAQREEDGQN